MAVQLSKEDKKHYVIQFLKEQIITAATELIHVTLAVLCILTLAFQ
jgi:hypothetical protein